ncbi:hypothetical protein OsI_09608 [Oryza sativa Indica Group]|uniref:tRNA (guanosine(18)-2'-O)-methyltransferase TARBP1 n=1 Tax=Oryza sativa subsp. indica TaxID=39946 RepID=B8AL00_ORYSI|nr:hypothetical protein OsI_09608 [Oryza sativa Indica Group]
MALAALERCFQAVPTDAVAGIVDCVLASSSWSSPSQLFHALLHSDHAAASSLPHAAALCHLLALLDQERPAEDSVRALLWRVFLPLLRQEDQLQHTIALMCDAVSTNQSFSDLLGATILPLCIRSSAIAMDMDLDSTLLFVYQTGEDPPPPAPGGLLLLPISKATAVLASLLQHTLERNRKSTSLNALLHNLTWDLSSLALNMFGHSQEYRSCATRVLLKPLLLSLADVSCVTVHLELAAAPQLKLSRSGFLESIWASCLSLFALGPAERLDAYNILSLYLSTLKHVILGPDEYDLRNSNDFWDEIRRGLVDKDSLVRKQALYILRISLDIFSSSEDNGAQQCSRRRSAALPAQDKSNTAMTKRERWAQKEAKSLGIGEMSQSDENCSSGKDRWKVFLLLYEMLQEYGTHLVEAAWTHQVMLLFESTPRSDYSNHMSYTVFHAQMESFEGFFHWMVVLWERGFTHDNPQVRYLVMHSFLDITWEHYLVCPQIVPRGFVLGPLLRGLNDVVHHKDFGVKGVYDSKIIKGAERFFGLYAQRLTTRVTPSSKYRLKVCEQVMKATTSLISAAEIPLNQLLYFISAIPREFTDYYGELRPMVQKWFVEKKECSSGNTLLEKLIDFPTTFVKHTEVNGPYLFDDEDVGAWEAEARRWARTLLLVTSEEQHFTQIFVIWSMRSISSIVTWCNNYCSDISLCSTLTFFWEFCWEVIQHHSYATEWLCLDSLLSFSCCRGENESLLKMLYPLFSESTLRSIFVDIIESLENAGENSVLAILRCVRSVLGLLHFSMRTRNLSSLGISYEMMMQFVKSSWILHLSCNKRRVAPIAALLSAVLHPAIFPNLEMHQENEKGPGPLKWFIENLLGEGSKSPRTIRLAALHLSGIWLMYPKTLSFYMEELKLLSLYGSVAFDEDFEAELSENHEARLEVSMLAQSPDREFTEVFINTELYARVSVAVLFDHLWKQIEVKSTLETEEALRSGKLFLLKLLDSAVNDKDISRELYKKYSSVHRRKVRIWQMICVLSQYVEDDIVKEVTSSIHICLYRNNLPAVRQYLETFAILIYLKFPALAEEQLIPIFHDNEMRQQALSSYVFIAANLILHSRELAVQINHLNELFPPIMPFLTSHHHSLRGFTQLLVHCVLSKMGSVLALGSSENPVFERRCFQDLKRYLAENTDCVRLRASVERFLDVFNPDTSGTPSGIFSSRPEVSFDFECVPVSVMERVINFLNDVREDLRQSIAKDSITIKNEDLTAEMHHKEDRTDENIVELLEPSQDVLNFQKKITPYRNFDQPLNVGGHSVVGDDYISRLLLDLEGDDQQLDLALESRNHAVETIKQSQQQLIVVASLVDRIPNLAGLTRTCEIFKAVGLAVADKSIIEDKQFRLISVTAEKWLPMMEVPVNSVKVFLEKKRLEGYSVIGLEQTANSKPLDHFSFPSKTVLVLGREKEGIPVDIIHVLDACVEIPQLGIVRSLNVHVSGAIAVWEYTRQQRIAT